MKILFTGGSSFTGLWFIRELARAGHVVVATFRRRPQDYADELRRKRVSLALLDCEGVFDCAFGSPQFLDLARREPWDLLCHHAADVTDYKSPTFDVLSAVANNTHGIAVVLDALRAGNAGRSRLLLTGSVFENDEGMGSEGLPAFSPYGISKSFTYQLLRYHAGRAGIPLGKFVIPNPFGPYEEPRFTAYLVKSWLAGQLATVKTPAYVRDNIHVSLLAKAYVKFAEDLVPGSGSLHMHPSGYPESQGAFALRLSREMQPRLGVPCRVQLERQIEFQEPRVRINSDLLDAQRLGWDESGAWDAIADYYLDLTRSIKT